MKRSPQRARVLALRPRGDARRGQALAEMAIILPILLLLVFGIIEMSNAWRTYQVITNVAREGARVAILPSTLTETEVRTRMEQGLTANGLATADPPAKLIIQCGAANGACSGTGDEQRIRIEYAYTFRILGPIVAWVCGSGCTTTIGTVTMASTTIMRKE